MTTRTLLLWSELPADALLDLDGEPNSAFDLYLWERQPDGSYRPVGPRLHPSDVARFKMMG